MTIKNETLQSDAFRQTLGDTLTLIELYAEDRHWPQNEYFKEKGKTFSNALESIGEIHAGELYPDELKEGLDELGIKSIYTSDYLSITQLNDEYGEQEEDDYSVSVITYSYNFCLYQMTCFSIDGGSFLQAQRMELYPKEYRDTH